MAQVAASAVAESTAVRERLVDEGLVLVSDAALAVLGEPITSRTALRWAIHGRGGRHLPTIKGRRGRRMTSVQAMRRFLLASSPDDGVPAQAVPAAAPAPKTPAADVAVLESFRRTRKGGRA